MRFALLMATMASLIVGPALAQQQNPPARDEPGNKAINSKDTKDANPVTGANSFTEGQAKSRIESDGFSNVTDLRKDDNGIWRGKAQKGGKSVNVSLDFKGNVLSQ
jgi:opacity protein-like surface antigen